LISFKKFLGSVQCNNGIRFFWNSSSTAFPSKAYENSEAAIVIDNFLNLCKDLCIRDKNGELYEPNLSDFGNITFIPYCEGVN
jgi:hypothetical protein